MPPKVSMDAKVEQRTVLRFLSRAGNTPIECWREMRTVFGADTMSKSWIRVWHKRFSEGRTSFKDDKHTGRLRSSRTKDKIKRVERCLQKDQRVTVRQLAEQTNISKSSVHTILKKDLHLSKLAPKLVPKVLTDEQKNFRVKLCNENLELLSNKPNLMESVITCDESWISVREIETKQASSVWIPKGSHAPRPAKARRQRAERKAMLTVFFDTKGVVLAEFLPPGETVDMDQYCATLKRVKEAIRKKRPKLWGGAGSGEESPGLSSSTKTTPQATPQHRHWLSSGRKNNIDLLAHPPYSPDLAPCDYFLFPRLKQELRGVQHRNLQEMKDAVMKVLRKIPAVEFERALMSMPIRWMKCVKAAGEYFEGRHLAIDPSEHGLEIVFGEGSEQEESSSEDEGPEEVPENSISD